MREMLSGYGQKKIRRVVGLMSGTSADGIDSALTEITGTGRDMTAKCLAYLSVPYPPQVRERVFRLFDAERSTAAEAGAMNVLLGELFAEAALAVLESAGLSPDQCDAIGSHGQTVWHSPEGIPLCGRTVRYTMQLGEGAVIAEKTGIPCVSDFRPADMAAGGQGAPLVPFTEYLLYRRENESILLQNIGGIGNVTVLPAGCGQDQVWAFDTGPGNMLMDGLVSLLTGGKLEMDGGGEMAARGRVHPELLHRLQDDPYYAAPPPKSTGRERYGLQMAKQVLDWMESSRIPPEDGVRTAAALTAWSIRDAYQRFILPKCRAGRLVVGGGGSRNPVLMGLLEEEFRPEGVAVQIQEDLGMNGDAKEAVAFALLADCALRGEANSLPRVTGASHAAVMGKLSLPAGPA